MLHLHACIHSHAGGGYSLEAQKDRLTKFAGFQHMEVVREYCDAGKSRKSITGRPEFTQMLQDVADGRDDVDYILVFKLSRLEEMWRTC